MLRSLFFILLAGPLAATAQSKLGKTLPELKKELDAFVSNNKSLKPLLTQSAGELKLVNTDAKGQVVQFIYSFDDSTGTCNQEKTISSCEPCYKKLLDELVSLKEFEWKRINESQYVSRFEDYLLIEMQETGKDFSFTLLKTAWTRALYDLMLQN